MDATVGLIGTAFLALLNEVDLAGQLKPDWEIRDLALVMAMYLQWAYDKPDYGLEDVKWMKDVVAYAKKGGIDLKAAPLCTVGDRLKKFSKTVALKGEAKADRWKFSKKVHAWLSRYQTIRQELTRVCCSSKTTRGGTATGKCLGSLTEGLAGLRMTLRR